MTSLSVTGCGLVETTKEKLGFEQSANELVNEACALYATNSTKPSAETIELLKQAVAKDENYRMLLEKVQSISFNFDLLKISKSNTQLNNSLFLKLIDSNAYIATYCG